MSFSRRRFWLAVYRLVIARGGTSVEAARASSAALEALDECVERGSRP
jgi:hypothetical protein